MKTIETVDEIEAIAAQAPLFARWQTQATKLPARSRNHASGGFEAGLSVNGLSGKSREILVGNLTEYHGISGHVLLLVTGEEVATGSDNEPIIINAQIVGIASEALLTEARSEEQINRCRRITDRGMRCLFGCID